MSGLGISQSDYESYYYKQQAKTQQQYGNYRGTNTDSSSAATNSITQNSGEGDTFVSSVIGDVGSGNTCTDGNDDGKISFFSKVANVAQGVVRGAGNIVKTALQHPIKTAATLAVGFIPVVGPAIMAGMCAYGAYNGIKEIGSAIQTANNATTDAEAKAAFEHIGSGGLTTGLSAFGMKASMGALKGQLSGGSTTVQAIKDGSIKTAGELGKSVINETGSNMYNFAKTTKTKVKDTYNKTKEAAGEFKNAVKEGNTYDYLAEKASKAKNTAVEKVDSLRYKDRASDVETARNDYKDAKAKYDAELKELKNNSNLSADELKVKTEELSTKYQLEELKTKYENVQKDSTRSARKKQTAENNVKASKEFADGLPEGEVTARYDSGAIKQQKYTTENGTEVTIDFNEQGAPVKQTEVLNGKQTVKVLDGKGKAGESSGRVKSETVTEGDTTTKVSTDKNGNTTTSSKTVDGKKTTESSKTYESGNDSSVYQKSTSGKTTTETYTYNGETYTCETNGLKKTWKINGEEVKSLSLLEKLRTKAVKYNAKSSVNVADYQAKSYTYQARGLAGTANDLRYDDENN